MTMFAPAVKEQLKARVALAGPSGAGKTFTAGRMATALAQGGKIAWVDTERRSASLYADRFTFDTLDFKPPYQPHLLVEAIRDAEKAGYAVLVIDSFTHFWSGPGGVLEIVENNGKGGNKWSGWAVGTPIQQAVVDAMLTADLHVIVCMRSKQEWAMETGANGKQTPTRVGMGVQQRGDIEYEFTVFGELDLSHRLTITKSRCESLADRVDPMPGEPIALELLEWLNSGTERVDEYVQAGWSGHVEHDQAKAELVESVKALPEAKRELFKQQREAAALPSLANVTLLHKANDVRRLAALIASLADGDESPAEPEPEPTPAEPKTTVEKSRAVKANDPIGQHAYDAIKVRKDALDPDYADQFQKDLTGASLLGFSANATKVDAATVEGLLDVIEARQKPIWDARRKQVFAALNTFDKDMSDDVRHQFISDATNGATSSTAKLTEAQAKQILDAAGVAERIAS